MQTVPVVVLGVGLSALGTLRSLGWAGLEPYLVTPKGDFAASTRWARGRVLHIEETDDAAALAGALKQRGFSRLVLIPCTDEWSEVVAELASSAPESFLTSSPDPAVVELLVDKLRFAETVERLGVPHPRTVAIESEADLDAAHVEHVEHAFLKPRHSQLFARRYHRKALTFDGPDEARKAYRMIAEVGLEAVLQEYIPGPPTQHYFVDGFVDRDARLAALFARRRLRMYPLDFGNSTLMVSVPLAEVQGAVEALSTLLGGIGYRGIFSAEFKLDARDGIYKILEVNARPWWFVEFATVCGVDVAGLAYRDALGLELPAVPEGYAAGERCVLLPQDFRAYRALRRSSDLSAAAWVRSWAGARSVLLDWKDPLPALSLPVALARRSLRLARGA